MLTPGSIRVARRLNIMDVPVAGKIHDSPTPLLGGVAVYLAFTLSVGLSLPLSRPVIGVILGGLAAVVIGVIDERLTLPPLAHLGGQVAVALVAVVAGVGVIHSLSNPSGLNSPGITLPAALGVALTLFWLVGMMNTVNFLDGMDGLAPGVVALAALLLAVWAAEPQRFLLPPTPHREQLVLPLALAGALLGFLPFNWHRARIFLGDSGSMFLGLALGSLAIVGPAKLGTALLVLIIPVLDVAWAVVRRQLQGRSFLAGDKQHVYHRMLELGMSHTAVVLVFYFLCFTLGVLDLVLLKVDKIIAFAIFAVVMGASFVLIEVWAVRRAPKNASPLPGRAGAPR